MAKQQQPSKQQRRKADVGAQSRVAELKAKHRAGLKLARDFPVSNDYRPGQSLPARAKYAAHGEQEFETLAAREGVSAQELFVRRRFALLYTPNDLRRLCARRTPDGNPLSWAIVKWLLRVEKPEEREALEVSAAQEGWTVADLKAELKLRARVSVRPGRPVRRPKTLEAGLVILTGELERMTRLVEVIVTAETSLVSTSPAPRTKAGQQQRVELATMTSKSLKRLRGECGRATKALEELQRQLESKH